MERRKFLTLTGQTIAMLGVASCGASEFHDDGSILNDTLVKLRALPGTVTYAIEVELLPDQLPWRITHLPERPVFIGSAFKTFVITTCLKKNEAGQLPSGTLITIDDRIRMDSSALFANLAGTVTLGCVLDAITSYSDNTATDAALALVGVESVRALIASAGLATTRIPDSLRLLTSYLAGAPLGTDIGWNGIDALSKGVTQGPLRPMINDKMSIISNADDLVSYYRQALRGNLFTTPETLLRFKRIHAKGNATFNAMPETVIYAKGGNASWQGFHAVCYPGQMALPNGIPITFAFAINWDNPDPSFDFGVFTTDFLKAVSNVLIALRKMFSEKQKSSSHITNL